MSKNELDLFAEEVANIIPHLIRGTLKKQADALGRGAITIPQYLCLYYLNIREKAKMKEVSLELNISLPAATGLIERLFRMGLIARAQDNNDRRLVYVCITEKGKSTVKRVQTQREKTIAGVFRGLSSKERRDYINILRKVKNNLSQN